MAPPSPYQVQLKRLAAHISREVREQWVQVERVAQYKHDQRLEAARKSATMWTSAWARSLISKILRPYTAP